MVWKREKRTGASRKQEKSKQKMRKSSKEQRWANSKWLHMTSRPHHIIYIMAEEDSAWFFPHPRWFFGFNTSCFWRWNVLYLYRDMGGASAPPISLYKYNTFHRQKQEVLKPKNRLRCGKNQAESSSAIIYIILCGREVMWSHSAVAHRCSLLLFFSFSACSSPLFPLSNH